MKKVRISDLERLSEVTDGNVYEVLSLNIPRSMGDGRLEVGSLIKARPKRPPSRFIRFSLVIDNVTQEYSTFLGNDIELKLVEENAGVETVGYLEKLPNVIFKTLKDNIYKVVGSASMQYAGKVKIGEVVRVAKVSGTDNGHSNQVMFFNYLGGKELPADFFLDNGVKLKLIKEVDSTKVDKVKAIIKLTGKDEIAYLSLNAKGYFPILEEKDAIEFYGQASIDIAVKAIKGILSKLETPPVVSIKYV